MSWSARRLSVIALLVSWPAVAQDLPEGQAGQSTVDLSTASSDTGSRRLVAAIREPQLRELLDEVLAQNAGLEVAAARARSAAQRAPQANALPDPTASVTGFVAPPETRTGPQRFSVVLSQGIPWFGKLALKEQSALFEAMALEAEVEAMRLKLVTEVRRIYYELAFLHRYREISEELRSHLLLHEEIARSRYSTGVGLGQSVVKLQAEITRVENRLLEIDSRSVTLVARVNSLRDRPATTAIARGPLPGATEIQLDRESLLDAALRLRPELDAADARISRAASLIQLAEKGYSPDFKVGLIYTDVGRREDAPGVMQPPPGNGDDIFGIQVGISLPIWGESLSAQKQEAIELETAAEEAKRQMVAAIRATVGDLTQRVPLAWQQLRLVEDLLVVQAEEALESAETGYIAGALNALDLLDAEHVLYEALTAVARAKADYLIGLAELEGEAGQPLQTLTITEQSES